MALEKKDTLLQLLNELDLQTRRLETVFSSVTQVRATEVAAAPLMSQGHLNHHQMSASDFHCFHFSSFPHPRKGEKDRYLILWQGGQRVGYAKLYVLHIHNRLPNLLSLSLSPLQVLLTLPSLLLMLSTETTVDPRELNTTAKLEADIELCLSNHKTKIFPCPSILGDFQSTVICMPWKWSRVLGCKPTVEINFNFIYCR